MKVTINIPQDMVTTLKKEVKAQTGRKLTNAEVEKFFQQDIPGSYFDFWEDGLLDAIDAYYDPLPGFEPNYD